MKTYAEQLEDLLVRAEVKSDGLSSAFLERTCPVREGTPQAVSYS
jgi:hypothetical protein